MFVVLQSKKHGAYKPVLLPRKLKMGLTPAAENQPCKYTQISNFTQTHLFWPY